jgi:hypothetical protein
MDFNIDYANLFKLIISHIMFIQFFETLGHNALKVDNN